MSEPVLQSQGGIFQLTWRDEMVTATIRRIREEKSGVFGELTITSQNPGFQPHLHGPVQFNLTSTTTRRALAAHLIDLNSNNWTGLLEQCCKIIVEEHRLGEPIVHIADHEPSDAVAMRVAPILQMRNSAVLFGEGDSLKSFFATWVSVITRIGKPQAGLIPEPTPGILYLDWETDVDTFWARVNMIAAGLGLPIPEGIYYRPMTQRLVDEMEALSEFTMNHEIGLVIVDSAAPATLEPEKAEQGVPFFASLRKLATTVIVIAHVTKASRGQADYPFGSTMWRNLARSNYQIKADRSHDSSVSISLRMTKSNNSRRLPPLGFRFNFTDDELVVTAAEPMDYPDLAQDVGLTVRIRRLLEDGSLTTKEIQEGVHAMEGENKTALNTISSTLSRGAKTGQFVRIGNEYGNPHQTIIR